MEGFKWIGALVILGFFLFDWIVKARESLRAIAEEQAAAQEAEKAAKEAEKAAKAAARLKAKQRAQGAAKVPAYLPPPPSSVAPPLSVFHLYTAGIGVLKVQPSVGHALLSDREALRRSVLVSEILAAPRAFRPYKSPH